MLHDKLSKPYSMNKIFTTLMLGAIGMTCLPAQAADEYAYVAPTPDKPLVIWEGNHETGDWNKLALNREKNKNWDSFLRNVPTDAYEYYIKVYDNDGNSYGGKTGLQIGTNYGYFKEDGTYEEINVKFDDNHNSSAWFNTLQSQDNTFPEEGLLITNRLVNQLNRYETLENRLNEDTPYKRRLQFNGSNISIGKIEIVAAPAKPAPVEYKTVEICKFTATGDKDGKADITLAGSENTEYSWWNSGNDEYKLYISPGYLSGLNLVAGNKLGFNFNYWGDSWCDVNLCKEVDGNLTKSDKILSLSGSQDNVTYFDLTEDMITNGICVTGKYININKVFAQVPKLEGETDPEDDGLINIFIPGVYPEEGYDWAKKQYFGYRVDKDGNPIYTYKEFGTGVYNPNVPSEAYGKQSHGTYSFYDEWWDESKYSNTTEKNTREMVFEHALAEKQVNSWPLQLIPSKIPNMARIKVGDQILINVTRRDPLFTADEDHAMGQAQVGTYDPESDEFGQHLENPLKAFYSITHWDNGKGNPDDNYIQLSRDMQIGESHTYTFDIGPKMLEYITRYGLTINGRLYDLNWVKAKVGENSEETTTYKKEEYFYNQEIPGSDIDAEFSDKGLVELTFETGDKYNETITHYYKDENLTNFVNSVSVRHDTDQTLSADNTDEFVVAVRYYESTANRWERLHVQSRLVKGHFIATGASTENGPEKNPAIGQEGKEELDFINGVHGQTSYKDGKGQMLLWVEDPAIRESIKQNGIQVRGKVYNVSVNSKNITTGVDDFEVDETAPVEIYTLTGIRVNDMIPGNVYIVKQGKNVKKVKA